MNVDNGKLRELSGDFAELFKNELAVNTDTLTKLQQANMQVSLNDHRSPAGKQLTTARAERRKAEREARKK